MNQSYYVYAFNFTRYYRYFTDNAPVALTRSKD